MILIGSVPSSGSTLMSVILDAHSEVFCGPEIGIFSQSSMFSHSWDAFKKEFFEYIKKGSFTADGYSSKIEKGFCPYSLIDENNLPRYGLDLQSLCNLMDVSKDVEDFLKKFFGPILEKNYKKIWAEKTPTNIYSMSAFLNAFPDARGLVIVRDGRDVICSLMTRGFSFSESSATWVFEAALSLSLQKHPKVKLIRYEDLVNDHHRTIESLALFLDISPQIENMMKYYIKSHRVRNDPAIRLKAWKNRPDQPINASSIGRYNNELTKEQLATFYSYRLLNNFQSLDGLAGLSAKDLLDAFGYPVTPTKQVSWDDLCEYFLNEGSILTDRVKSSGFHQQYVSLDFDKKILPTSHNFFLRILAMSSQYKNIRTELCDLKTELSSTKEELSILESELSSTKEELSKTKAEHELTTEGLEKFALELKKGSEERDDLLNHIETLKKRNPIQRILRKYE